MKRIVALSRTYAPMFVVFGAMFVAVVLHSVHRSSSRIATVPTPRTPLVLVNGKSTPLPAADNLAIGNGLTIDTNGQTALFSTFGGANGNVWIGGGGQSFGGAAFPGTGQNTSLGIDALRDVTTGNGNTALGYNALLGCTTCYTATAVGYDALGAVTTGIDNTAMGYLAGRFITTGTENTTVGVESLTALTTGAKNTSVGLGAGAFITTGTDNAAIGTRSRCGTTGAFNSCLGSSSGAGIQGATADVAIGPFTLQAETSSDANIAIGSTVLTALTTGTVNTCVGHFSGASITTGSENASLGHNTILFGNVSNDTALGAYALEFDAGGFNVGVGYVAGQTITSGVANVVIGYNASSGITTGNGNTLVGSNIAGLAGGTANLTMLADGNGNARWESNGLTLDGFHAPTSVDHGALGAGSTNAVGSVTGIGANNSVTLTYSTPFANRSWCTATTNSVAVAVETIVVTAHTNALATFSCYSVAAVPVLSNCDDFTYNCWGQ